MRIKVKNTVDATRRLFRAGIPDVVIDRIIGKEFDATEHLDITVPWLGQPSQWNLPPEVVEQITPQ